MTELAFVDVETTGLNPRVHKLWSIAIITEDTEYYEHFPVVLDEHTDLEALKINRYVDTLADDKGFYLGYWFQVAREVKKLLEGKILVGAAVHFDASFIERFLNDLWYHAGHQSSKPPIPPWHYKLLDVCTLTMGTLGLNYIPKLSECCELLNIDTDDSLKHNALYDAQLAQAVYYGCMNKHYGPRDIKEGQ